MHVDIELLGDVTATIDGRSVRLPADRRLGLIALLACHEGPMDRERIAYRFWPDASTARSRGNLRSLLARVRREPYGAALTSEAGRLAWRGGADVRRFRAALSRNAWGEALDAYRGELLTGVSFDGIGELDAWLSEERAELRAAHRDAGVRGAEALADAGRADDAARLLEELLRYDPLDEAVALRAASTWSAAGQRQRALRVMRAFVDRLRNELGVEPTAAVTEQLARLAHGHEEGASAARKAIRPPTRASAAPGIPFVGRERERAEVAARLARPDCRLLTLVAMGGTGKTRLALQILDDVGARYPGGTWFLPAAHLRSADDLRAELDSRLGRVATGEERSDAWWPTDEFAGGALLVLDDVPETREVIVALRDLVRSSDAVDILATSRRPLALEEEWLAPLVGLETPSPSSGRSQIRRSAAVQLFLATAERLKPSFAPSADELDSIARACRAVEGHPLAIELAAGWLRTLPVHALADEVQRSLDVLERPTTEADQEHASIRAVLERTWRRLAPDESSALTALGAFRSGFTLEAAEAVADVHFTSLATLVDRSLLQLAPDGRYEIHPLVEQLAREKLNADPRAAAQRVARHATWFADWMDRTKEAFELDADPSVGDQVTSELPNLLHVLAGADEGLHVAEATRIVSAFGWYERWSGASSGLRGRIERLLSGPLPAASPHRVDLLCLLAGRQGDAGDLDDAVATADRALALSAVCEGPVDLANVRNTAAVVRGHRGDHAPALELYRRAAAACREEDGARKAIVQTNMVASLLHLGRVDEAAEELAAAQAAADAAGQDKLTGLVGLWQARVAYHRDDVAAARARLDAAIDRLERARFSSLLARARLQRAFLDVVSGRGTTTPDDLGQALRILHKGGIVSAVGIVFRIAAAHCSLAGDAKGAAFLRGAAEGRRQRTIRWLTPRERRDLDACATAELSLDADEAKLAGRAASLSEAMAHVQTLLPEPPGREGMTRDTR